ncbi:MAG TPA: type II secretion system secretin GspD [Pseudomonadales bacterium]|nr:type II secretion system secretin GspD [Pseudomonadales bacterium]
MSLQRSTRRLIGAGLLMAVSASAIAQNWTVNFKDADIHEVIKFVADARDLVVVVDPQVKGKVRVVSSKTLNDEELYNLFLTVLEINGYSAIDSKGILHIVPSKDARTAPSAVNPVQPYNAQFITEVIQLKNIDAAKLIPILRPLVPQQSHMAAYANSNAIILSDTAANIERMRKLIEKVDNNAVEKTEIMTLQFASAEDVVSLITNLDKQEKADRGAAMSPAMLVADTRTNSVVVLGDEMARERVKFLIKHLDEPNRQNSNSRVIYLEYAKAVDVAAVLNKVVQNLSAVAAEKNSKKSAAVEADETTNALIITADKNLMGELVGMVKSLDIRRAQVLVEAIIVELQDVGGRELGVQWLFQNESRGFGSSVNSVGSNNALLGNVAGAALGNGTDANGDAVNTTLNLAAALAGAPGQVFGIGKLQNPGTDFAVLLNALSTDTEANILSTPSLLTLDNNEASITVGQEVPFVTGRYTSTGNSTNPSSPFQTIERQDVGITLKVTPHINEGDSLILELEQEVSSLTGASSSDLITNQRKINTSVMAQDGETIVLGGLVKDDVQESVQKVPLLGDIPLLGRLFRSNNTKITKTNLLVFIRPTIIRSPDRLRGATAEKYGYIRELQLQEREQGVNFASDESLPVLPEWQQQLEALQRDKNSEAQQ